MDKQLLWHPVPLHHWNIIIKYCGLYLYNAVIADNIGRFVQESIYSDLFEKIIRHRIFFWRTPQCFIHLNLKLFLLCPLSRITLYMSPYIHQDSPNGPKLTYHEFKQIIFPLFITLVFIMGTTENCNKKGFRNYYINIP